MYTWLSKLTLDETYKLVQIAKKVSCTTKKYELPSINDAQFSRSWCVQIALVWKFREDYVGRHKAICDDDGAVVYTTVTASTIC